MAVKAIILAAGRGTRTGIYGADRPKCLLPFAGRPLIAHQLAALAAVGVEDIVIVTGYRADMLALRGTRQVHNPRWANTNMVESLFRAESEFCNDMIVAYADIVYEPRVVQALLKSTHEISVVVDRRWRALWETRFEDPLSDAESLRLDASGRIVDIGNKVADIADIDAQYTGLMRFRDGGVAALRRARANLDIVTRPWMQARPVEKCYMTDLLMELILMNEDVHAVQIDAGWLEIDTVSDIEKFAGLVSTGAIEEFFDPTATLRRCPST